MLFTISIVFALAAVGVPLSWIFQPPRDKFEFLVHLIWVLIFWLLFNFFINLADKRMKKERASKVQESGMASKLGEVGGKAGKIVRNFIGLMIAAAIVKGIAEALSSKPSQNKNGI